MKKSLLLLCAVVCWSVCAAIAQPDSVKQKKEKAKKEKVKVPKEQNPFKGRPLDENGNRMPYFGQGEYNLYIQKNTKYPNTLRHPLPEGRVVLLCGIDIDGTVSVSEVSMSPHPELTKAVINAIKKAPKWYPGIQNGKPVKTRFRVVVNFKSDNIY